MVEIAGKTVCDGIAIGRIKYFEGIDVKMECKAIENTGEECQRVTSAVCRVVEELDALYEQTALTLGDEHAAIFHVHAMMLSDETFLEAIHNMIKAHGVNAEYAVACVGLQYANMLAEQEDPYFAARSEDVKDIAERVIRELLGTQNVKKQEDQTESSVILMTPVLRPSDAIQLRRENTLALVMQYGGMNSHAAILARAMGIPTLTDVTVKKEYDGQLVIVDGLSGKVIINPDEEIQRLYEEKLAERKARNEKLQDLVGKESVTRSGRGIKLYANISHPGDVEAVLSNDAEGIGLFRSEYLFLGRNSLPSEDEQYEAYRSVLEAMGDKKVIIRTMDIGADKQADYLALGKEENPALGCRAIRLCLMHPELLRTQLRALYRASSYGNLSILYPMISSVQEVAVIKGISRAVRDELAEEGVAIALVEEGIMIETPAAAILSAELSREVDFFSIGTNDLTQYTLAMDRQNANLEQFFDAHHPAVLRLIRFVCENAHKAGIRVGVCGELGADISLTEEFLQMGVDELSMSPGKILEVRYAIRNM